jgi:predicted CoA-binding protein
MVDIFRNSATPPRRRSTRSRSAPGSCGCSSTSVNEPAAEKVRAAGLEIVMNHCPAIEYPRLIGGSKEH